MVYVACAVAWAEDEPGHWICLGDGFGVPERAFARRDEAEAWAAAAAARRFLLLSDGYLAAITWSFDELTVYSPVEFRDWLGRHGVDWPDGERWSRVRVPPELPPGQVAAVVQSLLSPFYIVREVEFVP